MLMTHTISSRKNTEEFTKYLNIIDPDMKFTTEEVEDGGLAFLDTNTVQKEDGSLKFMVCHKKKCMDQCLCFKSSHPLIHNHGDVCTLYNGAESLVTEEAVKDKEKEPIWKSLNRCHYPDSAISLIRNPKT